MAGSSSLMSGWGWLLIWNVSILSLYVTDFLTTGWLGSKNAYPKNQVEVVLYDLVLEVMYHNFLIQSYPDLKNHRPSSWLEECIGIIMLWEKCVGWDNIVVTFLTRHNLPVCSLAIRIHIPLICKIHPTPLPRSSIHIPVQHQLQVQALIYTKSRYEWASTRASSSWFEDRWLKR